MLRRFWFTLEVGESPSTLDFGCGITARDRIEAVEMLHQKVFPLFGTRQIATCTEDIEIDHLDPNHVQSNMGPCVVKGVWYPWLS